MVTHHKPLDRNHIFTKVLVTSQDPEVAPEEAWATECSWLSQNSWQCRTVMYQANYWRGIHKKDPDVSRLRALRDCQDEAAPAPNVLVARCSSRNGVVGQILFCMPDKSSTLLIHANRAIRITSKTKTDCSLWPVWTVPIWQILVTTGYYLR